MHPASETGNGASTGQPSLTFAGVLEAREERWQARLALSQTCRIPVLSCTLRIPYDFRHDEKIISLVHKTWDDLLQNSHCRVIQKLFRVSKDGPEGLAAIAADPLELKTQAVLVELKHPIGWMLDLDVLDAHGIPIPRTALKQQELCRPRTCLVCGSDAKECIILKKHSRVEVCTAIAAKVNALAL